MSKKSKYSIGQTNSGKNVYDDFNHQSHKNFSFQDHLDSAKIHHNLSCEVQKYGGSVGASAYKFHREQQKLHKVAAEEVRIRALEKLKKQIDDLSDAFFYSIKGLEYIRIVYNKNITFFFSIGNEMFKNDDIEMATGSPIENLGKISSLLYNFINNYSKRVHIQITISGNGIELIEE